MCTGAGSTAAARTRTVALWFVPRGRAQGSALRGAMLRGGMPRRVSAPYRSGRYRCWPGIWAGVTRKGMDPRHGSLAQPLRCAKYPVSKVPGEQKCPMRWILGFGGGPRDVLTPEDGTSQEAPLQEALFPCAAPLHCSAKPSMRPSIPHAPTGRRQMVDHPVV